MRSRIEVTIHTSLRSVKSNNSVLDISSMEGPERGQVSFYWYVLLVGRMGEV